MEEDISNFSPTVMFHGTLCISKVSGCKDIGNSKGSVYLSDYTDSCMFYLLSENIYMSILHSVIKGYPKKDETTNHA